MAVTVEDVRIYLNGITEEELLTETIELNIRLATEKATSLGIVSNETFILKWAAWKSFLASHLYEQVKLHDINVKIDIEAKAKALEDAVDEELDAIDGMAVDSTPMFDERPEDPGDVCWPTNPDP